MASEHLVDPELLPALAALPTGPLSLKTLPAIRAARAMMLASAPAIETPTIRSEILMIKGPPGAPDVRIMSYRPIEALEPLPAFLHIHGGGYVVGSPEMSDISNRLLAADIGCAIYSVDYRLAPETPHPGLSVGSEAETSDSENN